MTYRENVTAQAAKLGISNDPGLREEDQEIAKLIFYDSSMTALVTIEASSMNRGGRLFFQAHAPHPGTGRSRTILDLSDLQEEAEKYFAELWEPNPVPGKRTLLDAIRNRHHVVVEIVWKEDVPDRSVPDEHNRTL